MDELGQLARSGVPEWIGLALTLLGIAWRVARTARQSATAQGQRIGELERRADLEQTRRRQVEAALLDDGLRLPYWPPDGPQHPPRRTSDDRGGEDYPQTWTTQDRPPVPHSHRS